MVSTRPPGEVRGDQDLPKNAQDRPKTPSEPPKTPQNAPGTARTLPRTPPRYPKSPRTTPKTAVLRPRGTLALVSHLGVRVAALPQENSRTTTFNFCKLTGSQTALRPTPSIICVPQDTPRVPKEFRITSCTTSLAYNHVLTECGRSLVRGRRCIARRVF